MKLVEILLLDESIPEDEARLIIRNVTEVNHNFAANVVSIVSDKTLTFDIDTIDLHGISDDTDENYERAQQSIKENLFAQLERMNYDS